MPYIAGFAKCNLIICYNKHLTTKDGEETTKSKREKTNQK